MKPEIFLCGGAAQFPNYAAALSLAGAELASDVDACDGLLLPGGGDLDPARYGRAVEDCRGLDPARDELELEVCGRFIRERRPVLGICRGAQVLAVALGGNLIQHIDNHEGLPDGRDRVHDTQASGLLAWLYGPRFAVNSWHHQAVGYLPPGCRVLQTADDGVIEACGHTCLPLLAVQWHPERLCGGFARPDAVSGLPLLKAFTARCAGGTAWS